MADIWQAGAETKDKERDFRGLLGIHLPVVKAIRRAGDAPYLFIDLHGGPGQLEYAGERFPGSPLVAIDEMRRAAFPYQSVHFEKDPRTAEVLRAAVDMADPSGAAVVRSGMFEMGLARWLLDNGKQPYRHGLIYSDPISDPIPVEAFNMAAEFLPRVDLLAYVAANQQYKRANANGGGHGRRLADDVRAVKKKVVLVREPRTAMQWTFILWSNWERFPEWRKRGFCRLDTVTGERILNRLNLTEREQHEAVNEPLPFGDEEPPYRTYREYLKHPQFLKIRAGVFERAGGSCERCRERPPTEPHHLRYPPWGTFDVPENMIAICHQCHCVIHGKAS